MKALKIIGATIFVAVILVGGYYMSGSGSKGSFLEVKRVGTNTNMNAVQRNFNVPDIQMKQDRLGNISNGARKESDTNAEAAKAKADAEAKAKAKADAEAKDKADAEAKAKAPVATATDPKTYCKEWNTKNAELQKKVTDGNIAYNADLKKNNIDEKAEIAELNTKEGLEQDALTTSLKDGKISMDEYEKQSADVEQKYIKLVEDVSAKHSKLKSDSLAENDTKPKGELAEHMKLKKDC